MWRVALASMLAGRLDCMNQRRELQWAYRASRGVDLVEY